MQKSKIKKFAIYNSPFPAHRGRAGFTLIEVLVAITILAISLVMVMQLFSGGLRASKTSCDYTRAIVHAKDKMEEMNIDPVQGRGEFGDGFTWETEVSPAEDYTQVKDDKSLDNEDMNLLKIKVKIEWPNMPNQQKAIELVSLKAAKKEK